MGMNHDEQQAAADRHLLLHFTRNGAATRNGDELLVLERGEGPYVFDTRGRCYLDALSSLFCSQIGYSFGEATARGRDDHDLRCRPDWAGPPAGRLVRGTIRPVPIAPRPCQL